MATKEPGYVYILTNPSFREDWIKIGKTTNMEERLRTLYTTALPLPFEPYATMKTAKYNEAEKLVHHYIERFTNLRIEKKREFFNVKPEEALEIFREVATLLDDAVIEEVYKTGMACGTDTESKRDVRKAGENRVWLIPYNKKFFDLKGCYDKFGEVYWTQHFHFQAGDTGYIYGAAPESAIRFSFKIKEAAEVTQIDEEKRYLWGKNFPYNSEIKFEYYSAGIHKSYPDFILKDKRGRIHIFEVKSVNGSGAAGFDTQEYMEKINELKDCYKAASAKLKNHLFYIPVKDGDDWQIFRYKDGEELPMTKQQFKSSFNEQ